MKTMNYFFSIVLVFFLSACTTENHYGGESLIATKAESDRQEEQQEIFALDLHQYYLLEELAGLYVQKSELEIEIEEGNEGQITVWESVMEQINQNSEALISVLETSCSYLRMREKVLQIQVIGGDEQAKGELEEVREKLKKCPIELETELNIALETQTIILAIKNGGIGGRCLPGEEWTCYDELDGGILLINIVEAQGEQPEVFLKDADGEIISQGEFIGKHSRIEGVTQIALELQSIENGVLQFVSETGSFDQVITVF